MNSDTKILFMGTPDLARVVLERLHKESFNIIAVFAQPDKPAGRGKKMHTPPVAEFAQEKGLPLYQPFKIRDMEVLDEIKRLAPDFIVVVAYGKILPESLLASARMESLNIHASLLPDYRGAAPINYAILKGEDETGISIMRMVKAMDAGPVFLTKKIKIADDDNAISLTEKLSQVGADAIVEAIARIQSGEMEPEEQDHDKASFAPKLSRELSPIDWGRPAREISNQVRALLPWPVACSQIEGKTVKIYLAQVLEQKSEAEPGTIAHIAKAGWTVTTGSTDLLVKEVQLEGKKRMNAFDLANGMRLEAGGKLG